MRFARLSLWLAVALTVNAGAVYAADQRSLEYPVKAAFLYKFADFIQWPSGTFESPTAPITLCVIGDDPFGRTLDDVVAGEHIGAHPIAVKRLPAAMRDSGCQILYAAGSKAQSVVETLAAVAGGPVLTVTDAAHDPDAPGMIHFVVRDNRVRFEIDDVQADRSRLEISSKLLSLALSVRSRADGGRRAQ